MLNRRQFIPVLLAPFAFQSALKADTEPTNYMETLTESPLGLGKRKTVVSIFIGNKLKSLTIEYENGFETYSPLSHFNKDGFINRDSIQLYSDWSQRLANGKSQIKVNGVDFILDRSGVSV